MKNVLLSSVCLSVIVFAIYFSALSLGWLKSWVGIEHLIYPTAVAFGVFLVAAMYFKFVVTYDHQSKNK